MQSLRNLAARPLRVVTDSGLSLFDPVSRAVVVAPGPLGRERVVNALPTNESQTGPVQITPHVLLVNVGGYYIGDPDGKVVGDPAIYVHRLLQARWTEDTRALT